MLKVTLALLGAAAGAIIFLAAPIGVMAVLEAVFPRLYDAGPESGWGLIIGLPFVPVGLVALLLVKIAEWHLGSAVWLAPALSSASLGVLFLVSWTSRGMWSTGSVGVADFLTVVLLFIMIPAVVFARFALRPRRPRSESP